MTITIWSIIVANNQ